VRLLGAPEGSEQAFERFATGVIKFAFPTVGEDDFDGNVAAVTEGFELVHDLVARLRREPGEDILSALIRFEEEGDRLSSEELLPLIAGLLLGAWDTTGQALAFALWSLLGHPEQVDLLRRRPELIKGAIEETLRFDYFARHGAFRYAEEDLTLCGAKIARGQCVIGSVASAHRDPLVFRAPDVFDITRTPAPLLSFGGGAHTCIGMALARLVMQTAALGFVERFPDAALVGAPTFEMHPVLRGMSSLVITTRSSAG
jgi:cytochrome P450